MNHLLTNKGLPQLGTYVKYNGVHYMVYKHETDSLIKITNPTLGGSKSNVTVKASNVLVTNKQPAVIVNHKDSEYFVTGLEKIFNTKGREMKWAGTNGDRLAILRAAEQQRLFNGTTKS